PFDESLLPKVRALPDVKAAIGGVGGEAQLIGRNGKAIVFGGAPNLGFSVDPTQPDFNSLTLVQGSWPKDGEVVVDRSTAGKKDIRIGQRIGVQAEGPVERLRVSGLVKFGGVSTIGGATLVGLFLGLALGEGLFKLFDVVGFTLPNNGLTFQTRTIVVALIVGVLVTLLASLRPALRATRVPPIAAVREGATLPEGRFTR